MARRASAEAAYFRRRCRWGTLLVSPVTTGAVPDGTGPSRRSGQPELSAVLDPCVRGAEWSGADGFDGDGGVDQ